MLSNSIQCQQCSEGLMRDCSFWKLDRASQQPAQCVRACSGFHLMGWEMAGLELDGRTGDCLTDFQPLVVAAEIQMQMLRA